MKLSRALHQQTAFRSSTSRNLHIKRIYKLKIIPLPVYARLVSKYMASKIAWRTNIVKHKHEHQLSVIVKHKRVVVTEMHIKLSCADDLYLFQCSLRARWHKKKSLEDCLRQNQSRKQPPPSCGPASCCTKLRSSLGALEQNNCLNNVACRTIQCSMKGFMPQNPTIYPITPIQDSISIQVEHETCSTRHLLSLSFYIYYISKVFSE